jgi:hypothetical protein
LSKSQSQFLNFLSFNPSDRVNAGGKWLRLGTDSHAHMQMPRKVFVMIRISRRVGFSLRRRPGLAMSLIAGLGFCLTWPSASEGAKLSRFLTAEDVAGRLVLDQNGQQIQLPIKGDRHPELAKGTTPTYLAIPLHGGEHLPGSIQTLITGPQQGQNPVGPLNLNTLVKLNLDNVLSTSRLAVVDTPAQDYLVEFLPRKAHSSSSLDKAVGSATNTANELSHLLNAGSTQFSKLTQSGMTDLEKFLHISSKTSTLKPNLNLEAQVLSGDGQPAAVPEPDTWIVFTVLIAGTAILRKRLFSRVCTNG